MQMQNWDYLFVMGEDGHPRYVNGQEIPNWKEGPTMFGAMNHLIWKGWKLVSHPSIFGLGNPLIFRRPKNNRIVK
jgi:hypothetical protein